MLESLAIRYFGGVLKITQDLNKRRTTLYRQRGEFRNRWIDFRFQARFSTIRGGARGQSCLLHQREPMQWFQALELR